MGTGNARIQPILCLTLLLGAVVLEWSVRDAAAESALPKGVVVLKDGRVFSGTVSEVVGGYRVARPDGNVVIPFEQTRLTAESLPKAYEILRDSVRRPTAEDHILLAEWCLNNQLLSQARSEAVAALTLEPLRTDAKALLKKVDSAIEPDNGRNSPSRGTSGESLIPTLDGYVVRSETAPSGLTREAQQDFIRRIQPLLVNSCGNASCHGSAAMQPPVIMNARVGSVNHRQSSQGNLETVLNYIDAKSPLTSPLLTMLDGTHPRHPRVFSGRAGTEQYLILKAWVEQIAKDGVGHYDSSPSPAVAQAPGKLPENSNTVRAVTTASESRRPPVTAEPNLLKMVTSRDEPDPFDPEEFNRRVHGATATELRRRIPNPASVGAPPVNSPM